MYIYVCACVRARVRIYIYTHTHMARQTGPINVSLSMHGQFWEEYTDICNCGYTHFFFNREVGVIFYFEYKRFLK